MIPEVSVVICTYNRPRLLEAAVRSCLRDATRRGLSFEIVIADNSREGHAAPLVAALAAEGHVIRSVPVSPPNISVARNAGLRAATAALVAFLDDDLEVEPGWLDHFVETMRSTGADAAIGPVRPRFAEGFAPAWDSTGARFTRVLTEPTGFAIFAGEKARPGFAVSTASSIWRRDTCFTDAQPFDIAYGTCGGEDIDLFLRLEHRSCRFVWCAEAGVWETIPAGRTTRQYHLLRAFSSAQVYTAVTARHSTSPRQRAAGIMARGAAQAVIGAITLLPWALRDLVAGRGAFIHTMSALLQIANGCGKLVWWNKVALYHIEKPATA